MFKYIFNPLLKYGLQRKEAIINEVTTKTPVALTGTYQILLTVPLTPGRWRIQTDGNINTASNNKAKVALFVNGVEIDGTDGHTHRIGGSTDPLLTVNTDTPFCATAIVTVTSNVNATLRGIETVGSNGTFTCGRLEAVKLD